MSPKNNLSPLPFFESENKRHKWYANGAEHSLIVGDALIPFQIIRPKRANVVRGDALLVQTSWDDSYLKSDGTKGSLARAEVLQYEVGENTEYYLEAIKASAQGCIAVFYDEDGNFLSYIGGADYEEGYEYIGAITSPANAAFMDIQGNYGTFLGGLYECERIVTPINDIRILDACTHDDLFGNVATSFALQALNKGEYDVLLYSALNSLQLALKGDFYLKMSDGEFEWYSLPMSYHENLDKYIKISWWDEEDLFGNPSRIAIAYEGGYKNYLYLDGTIARPTYEFEDEVESRGGYEFPLRQISYKKYNFNALGVEEICDAMRIIRLSDHIKVEAEGETYICNSFLVNVDWLEGGYMASMDCEFTTNSVIKRSGAGYAFKGAFNDDYNESYN